MSYYDSTVAYYDNQIWYNNQRISSCNRRIKQLEDDIEELKKAKAKVANVNGALARAADDTSRKIAKLPSLTCGFSSALNRNFFSGFLDAVNGSTRAKAQGGINNANSKIEVKIREMRREIDNLRNEIRSCKSNISSLSWQRENYILSVTRSESETN